jgi:hypothetical protein
MGIVWQNLKISSMYICNESKQSIDAAPIGVLPFIKMESEVCLRVVF